MTENFNLEHKWKDKAPSEWSCNDYMDFVKDLDINLLLYNFYNSIYDNGDGVRMSEGFHPCSIHPSREWAFEGDWMLHKCNEVLHKDIKHSILDMDSNVASWKCPETGKKAFAPFRYVDSGDYVQLNFTDEKQILEYSRRVRVWHWELSLYDNAYRGVSIYPKSKENMISGIYEEQWNRVISHPFILEVDASREEGKRRDLLSNNRYLEGANEFISCVNDSLIADLGLEIGDWEWWFSGNGLYMIMNPYMNSIYIKENETNGQFFKRNLIWWDSYVDKLTGSSKCKKIRYVRIDDNSQHLRFYIKAPFSLHSIYDRLCIPLTCLFEGNDRIDLTNDLFKTIIYPKNLTKEIMYKYFIDKESGLNKFMKVELPERIEL